MRRRTDCFPDGHPGYPDWLAEYPKGLVLTLHGLIGKGGRVRSVPMPSWAKAAIDVWVTSAGFNTG